MFEELKSVPKSKDLTQTNHALEKAIEAVRSKYPHRFLQNHELKDRRFYDEPEYPTLMASYIHPAPSKRVSTPTPKPRKKK